jgi:hypothetical protein
MKSLTTITAIEESKIACEKKKPKLEEICFYY